MVLFAATTNAGKLREFAQSAWAHGVEVRALPGLAELAEPGEDALTFMGNAEIKARAYSLAARGELVFADDSGLAVDALGGAPGVRSARWAEDEGFVSEGSRDARNNALLLAKLESVEARGAEYVCALAVARDGEVAYRAEDGCRGEILREARGHGGFGYDPLFFVPELGRAMAEMTAEEKWRVSHRGRAFRKLMEQMMSSAKA